MIEVDTHAPDFELETDSGESQRLADLRGKTVVLFFYPQDDSPGCTAEACSFRDIYDDFQRQDVVVLGVSPDDVTSHASFREKHGLPYTLLSDPGHEVARLFDVVLEKEEGVVEVDRATFVIDGEGFVKAAMRDVSPASHADEILAKIA